MKTSNPNFRRDKIPMWINFVSGVVVAILLFQMYACFVNPSLAYGAFENVEANRQAILTLAGRNLVMVVVIIAALRSQNAMFLSVTFLMNVVRESYDMMLVGYLNHFSFYGLGMMATFLIFLIPYLFALKRLRQLASIT